MNDLHDDELIRLQQMAAKERRERIAIAVLQGIMAHPGAWADRVANVPDAIKVADALIAELDKGPQP